MRYLLVCLALAGASARLEAHRPYLALRGGALPATKAVVDHLRAAARPEQLEPTWWVDHRMLVLVTGGSLAVLAPVLLKLPRAAAITAAALVVALVQMAFDQPADQVLLETTVALVAMRIITLPEALKGFASEGVVSVAVMCAVAKAVQVTGGLDLITRHLLGSPHGYEAALLRLTLAVMAMSAFMNNTPVVAMMMPIVTEWAGGLGLAPSGLLMPLSFASMLGGTLSMIGCSSNLIAAGAASKHDPSFSMGVFDITTIGLVNAAAGLAYMLLAGRRVLPVPPAAPAPAARKPAGALAPPPRGALRLWLALGLIAGTMSLAARNPKALLPVALGCLCVLVRTGCMTLKEAWSAVNGPVLLSIALSFALGTAMTKSELATTIAEQIVSLVAPHGELALLFAIYFVAILVGAVISNNAVVVLMFPIVVKICEGAGVSWKPALYALTLAASASFSTPVSYQTNLMVADAAGYSFADFIKFGVPLQLVCMLATVPACYYLVTA